MSTTLTIPADVIPDVREGVFCLLGDAAEGIMHALERRDREHHPEWFRADRDQLSAVFALLDLIGWSADREPLDVQLDLAEHGATLKDAIEGFLPLLEDLYLQAAAGDSRPAQEGRRSRKEAIATRLARLGELLAAERGDG